jgi:DNA-binding response OmpR family regulator
MLQARSKRLLFVDDEPNIRATLPVILRRHGFEVEAASTVTDAVEIIQQQKFDVLLCDLNIAAVGDGYEVVHAMREVNPRCVAVILTGYPDFESAVQGIHSGVDDYIIKPAGVENLVSVLNAKLAQRQPKARILSVSYDELLLRTRHMLLEREGYEVVSTLGLTASLEQCRDGGFDIFVLGHSIPRDDKKQMVNEFRRFCPAPIISLRRNAGEDFLDAADFHIEPDPEPLVKLIADVISGSAPSD